MSTDKRGRPLTGTKPYNKAVRVMLDDTTYNNLSAYCQKTNLSRSEAVRKMVEERFKAKE